MQIRNATPMSPKLRDSMCRLFNLHAVIGCFILLLVLGGQAWAQSVPAEDYGPYNGTFLPDGPGLSKKLSPLPAPPSPFAKPDANATPSDERSVLLKGHTSWTLAFWFHSIDPLTGTVLVAGIGDPAGEDARFIGVKDNHLALWLGSGANRMVVAESALSNADWHLAVAVGDGGKVTLYADGKQVAAGNLAQANIAPKLELAPPALTAIASHHFGGAIAGLKIYREALTADQVAALLPRLRTSKGWYTKRVQSTGPCRPLACLARSPRRIPPRCRGAKRDFRNLWPNR